MTSLHEIKENGVDESQQLKEVGLKITTPRLNVLHIFEQAKGLHLSAEEVHKALAARGEEVSLATIYRILTRFEAAGLLHRHHFEGGYSVYELSQGTHHDHLVCVQCGRVQEFVDEVIEKRQHLIATQAQFNMLDHVLTIYGRCHVCTGSQEREQFS